MVINELQNIWKLLQHKFESLLDTVPEMYKIITWNKQSD